MYAVKFLLFVVIVAIAFASKSEKKNPISTSELKSEKSSKSSKSSSKAAVALEKKSASSSSSSSKAMSKKMATVDELTDKKEMLMEFLRADKNEIYGVCLTCHTNTEDICYGIARAMCGKPEKNPDCVPDYTYDSATKECDYCLA